MSKQEIPKTLEEFVAMGLETVVQVVQPVKVVNAEIGAVVDCVTEIIRKTIKPNKIVKGGSYGKGTNLVDRKEVDLVVVYNDYVPDEANCTQRIHALQKCLTDHLGLETMEGIYAEHRNNHRELIARLRSVKLEFMGISIDILPAPLIAQANQFYELNQRKELPFASAAASLMQVEFIRPLDAQYKDLVRLCKCWRNSLSEFDWTLSTRPSSYLIELLALYVYNQQLGALYSHEKAFKAFLTLLTMPSYEISWNHMLPSGSHYNKNDPMAAKPLNGRLVVDPGNPTNNVANFLVDWTDITNAALITLSMLEKGSSSFALDIKLLNLQLENKKMEREIRMLRGPDQ
eukprot:gene9132-10710_t